MMPHLSLNGSAAWKRRFASAGSKRTREKVCVGKKRPRPSDAGMRRKRGGKPKPLLTSPFKLKSSFAAQGSILIGGEGRRSRAAMFLKGSTPSLSIKQTLEDDGGRDGAS